MTSFSAKLNDFPGAAPRRLAVLVVDDHAAVREGVSRLVACAALPLRGVHTAAGGAEALRTAAWLHPDVIVLDVDLDGEDGLALVPLFAPGGVLVLTSHGDAATRARALALGARGFIEKHEPAAVLLAAIARVGHLQMGGEKAPATAGSTSHPVMVGASDVAAGLAP